MIKDICVHPAPLEALTSGANVPVVEADAIPRDADYASEDWLALIWSMQKGFWVRPDII